MISNLELSKQELIKDLLEKQESGILEKTNVELLTKLINNSDNLTEANAIAMLGTTYKQTGFHFDKRLEKWGGGQIKYLKRNNELSFITNENNLTHKLIIGDNYDILLNLLITYRNKIDVIYIDPPYAKDNLGEFAITNYDNAITRDNLLSMLYPRLVLAKQLLIDEGVIFCSIDHRNEAYLKCLFDELFLENNFISSCFCLDNLKGKANDSFITNIGHRILVYAKNKKYLSEIGGFKQVETINEETIEEKYKEEDDRGLYKEISLLKSGQNKKREDRPKMYYPILIKNQKIYSIKDDEYEKIYNDETKKFDDNYIENLKKQYINKGFEVILPISSSNEKLRWTNSFYQGFKKRLNKEELIYKNGKIYQKDRPKKVELLENIAKGNAKSLFYKPDYANGTEHLERIIPNKVFSFPKPVSLIIDLLKLIKNENCIVLDFFAGSGTTGQAVMELNKEDKGNRTFILCTNNEVTNTTPNGIAYDVTAKRLKRIMSGTCYDGSSKFEWIKKNSPYCNNLEVLEIEKVSSIKQDTGKTAFDVIDETLYDMPRFENIRDKISWICSNFDKTQKYIEEEK